MNDRDFLPVLLSIVVRNTQYRDGQKIKKQKLGKMGNNARCRKGQLRNRKVSQRKKMEEKNPDAEMGN